MSLIVGTLLSVDINVCEVKPFVILIAPCRLERAQPHWS
jgi:hypothetical protein